MSERLIARARNIGDLAGIELVGIDAEPPKENEVEILVEACALNFKDVMLALGVIPADSFAAFGFECAGRISRVGSKVAGLAVGDAVLAMGSGCLASSVCVPASTVRKRPPALDTIAGATVPVAFATASYAIEDLARLRMGERILIHTATGGVGLAAVQIAKRLGAKIFATAGSDAKRAHLRELGITDIWDSRTPEFAAEILRLTDGRGVDVVLNSLSGDLLEKSLSVLGPHGRFVELGVKDALEGRAIALSLFERGGSFCMIGYREPIPRLGARFGYVVTRVQVGDFQPLPTHVFPAEEIADAFSFLSRARHIGKVVVTFSQEARAERESASTLVKTPTVDPLDSYLTPEEGILVFEQALAAGARHVVVSKSPLGPRLAGARGQTFDSTQTSKRPAAPAPKKRPRHPRPALATALVHPRNEAESALAEVFGEYLKIAPVGVDDDFFALGGDSLLAVQVTHAARTALATDVPAHLLLENPTVAGLAKKLTVASSEASTPASPNLVRLASGPRDTRPLFLVHPIGGHVYFYRPLALLLQAVAPVYGIQAQGIDGTSKALETIESMAAQYVASLKTVQPTGPYRIGGSSFGGIVAYEMARILSKEGAPIELLALVDSPGPGALPSPLTDDAEILGYLLSKGGESKEHVERLRALGTDDRLRYFVQHGGAAERLSPDEAGIEGVRHYLALFNANYHAMVRYEAPAYAGAVTFFRASEDDGVNPPDMDRAWRPRVGALEVIPVAGNHTTMNLPPNVERIAAHLSSVLEESLPKGQS